MTVIFDDEATLAHLDVEIAKAKEAADAEQAFRAANAPGTLNPWQGAERRLNDLLENREQVALKLKGRALTEAHERLQGLNRELAKAEVEREAADHLVQTTSEPDAVKKFKAAPSIARAIGVAHDFCTSFSDWYLSGRPRYPYAPECVIYFMDDQEVHPGLHFTEAERDVIRRHHEAVGAANTALTHWCSLAELRAALLREHPELRGVA